MKEKHVKLKLYPKIQELGGSTVLPRLHAQSSNGRQRKQVVYNALGWRMAERIQQAELLPGDTLDIAFTLDHNDHPDFGGLELSLRDFKIPQREGGTLTPTLTPCATEN
jgi:hypothetical protein